MIFDFVAFAPGVRQARREGHDDKTIVDHLSIDPQAGEHVDRARASGLTDRDIADHVHGADGGVDDTTVDPIEVAAPRCGVGRLSARTLLRLADMLAICTGSATW
jgi:hypothetical protein